MKVLFAKHCGFCFGVKNAVDIAFNTVGNNVFTYGNLIHNEIVLNKLIDKGIKNIESLDNIKRGDKIIIRSHGISKAEYDKITLSGATFIDATCPFVKKIHNIVHEKYNDNFHIVIMGEKNHPEVIGLNGWCENTATIIDENFDLKELKIYEKLCFVAQTTFNVEKYLNIVKNIEKHQFKTVELFDTICYTTYERQNSAVELSLKCTKMLILGSKTSSNTSKLFEICKVNCTDSYLIEKSHELKKINFSPTDAIGIVAGASTPLELIMEVKVYMSQQFEEVQSKEFIDGVEESLVSYKEGKRINGTIILADDSGIKLVIGGKKDGFIPKDEVNLEKEYNPNDYPSGTQIEAIIISKQDVDTGCVLLSKKKVDQIKEGDKVVETIRNGEVFEFKADKDTKGGLLGKLGTYTVFIPASQIKEGFVKDLRIFINKPLRLTAIEIDDAKHKIVASQRKVIEKERKEKEEIFWQHVQPNVIVNGKVKRITNFGAFVSVDGFDCLAHIVDLSWSHVKSVEEVLKIGESYDFIVLSVDKEKGRVSLSYKLLQSHPFDKCIENHPVGSITKGKVVSLMPFGAFVEIESGIEGLVHVSEAARGFVKNINEVVKVGDEIDVMILNADPSTKKITLSIKATLPEEEITVETSVDATDGTDVPTEKSTTKQKAQPKKSTKKFAEDTSSKSEWSDDSANTPFAQLFKDFDIDENK